RQLREGQQARVFCLATLMLRLRRY
ncbi:hypothetical protein D020_3855B, partial [Vibrio parahaemolyticus SBR10290]